MPVGAGLATGAATRDTAGMSDTASLPRLEAQPMAVRRPRLRLLFSAGGPPVMRRVFSLPTGQTLLGRKLPSPHREILLPEDAALSSVHARLTVSGDTYRVTIEDLGSKNGTFIERQKLAPGAPPSTLEAGQVLRVGGSLFVLTYEPAQAPDGKVPQLIGESLEVRALRARITKLAAESVPVLVLGETGTGKEVVAAALHRLSGRPGELLALNCAAIAENLAESELFGHTDRAFTDAKKRLGIFASAHERTLFLDEIADLPESLQPKLLRALEEGKVRPVGSDISIDAAPRLVAATHQDLEGLVEDGEFRRDLYNRLAHFVLKIPPLRERREDILPILFGNGRELPALRPDLVEDLLLYDWPGNVRELLAVAERLRIEADTEELRAHLRRPSRLRGSGEEIDALPGDPKGAPAAPAPARPYRFPTPSRAQLVQLLSEHQGTVAAVANALRVSRRQVQRWMARHNLSPDAFRHPHSD